MPELVAKFQKVFSKNSGKNYYRVQVCYVNAKEQDRPLGMIFLDENMDIDSVLNNFKVGEIINVVFERYEKRREAELKIKTETSYSLSFMEEQSKDLTEKKKQNRALWLSAKE